MIVGVYCEKQSKDHPYISFSTCLNCARTCINKCPLTTPILKGIFSHIKEEKENITATTLSGCPRELALVRRKNIYIDPMREIWAFRGVLSHQIVNFNQDTEGVITEKRFHGNIGGIEFSGQPDEYVIEKKFLRDYKTCERVPTYNSPFTNHITQLNLYKYLLSFNGYEVEKVEVVYISMKEVKRLACSVKGDKWLNDYILPKLKVMKLVVDDPTFLPPKAEPRDENYWQCNGYCDTPQLCWNNFILEVQGGKLLKSFNKTEEGVVG